jgi:hypothetical protein
MSFIHFKETKATYGGGGGVEGGEKSLGGPWRGG